MRKIAATATLSLATLTGMAAPATAVETPTTVAVEAPAAVNAAAVTPVAEDDNDSWGLWGLLGLLGLAGLLKKNKTKTVPVERGEYGPGPAGATDADGPRGPAR